MANRGDYSIRIVDEYGNPRRGKKVHLTFWGTFGGTWEDDVTVDGDTIVDDDFMMEDGGTWSFSV